MTGAQSSSGEGSEVDTPSVDQLLRLMPDASTPLYLQIVHQLKQQIISQRLDDGARLPAVRQLAEALGVNPGTVVQAYRELANDGLVESVRGRGTVVRHLTDLSGDDQVRAVLLERAAAAMAIRTRALGFGPDEAREQLSVALLAAAEAVPVLFVGFTRDQAVRYVGEQLGPRYADGSVAFDPVSLDDVVKGSRGVLDALQVAYTVVTFVTCAPDVERALVAHGLDAEIIGVTAELSRSTIARLKTLDLRQRYTLVTEHRAVTAALASVVIESSLDRGSVDVVAAGPDGTIDDAAMAKLVHGTDTVIYSFGVARLVEGLELEPARLLELRFVLTDQSLARLDTRWRPS